jgi:hypothetical protein
MSLSQSQVTSLAADIKAQASALNLQFNGSFIDGQLIASIYNAASGAYSVDAGGISQAAVFSAFNATEYAALDAATQSKITALTSNGATVDFSNASMVGTFTALLSASYPKSLANLLALATRPASRAESLFGAGTLIDANDVGAAMLGGA